MRRTTASIGILGVAAALSLTAVRLRQQQQPQCGGLQQERRRRRPPAAWTARRTSGAEVPKTVDLGKATGKVGVILPDTTSSTRYTLYDAPLLQKALQGRRASPPTSRTPGGSTEVRLRSRRA